MGDIDHTVRTVLADVLGGGLAADGIDPDVDLVEYGLDSLKAVSLLLGVEEALGVELSPQILEFRPLTLRGLSERLPAPSGPQAPA
ncbi:acyl carrier protein [Streptomyces sp. JW3]|uniref:acyl carrier protein n=1 Tax=Streptomyces sp. JW3 TaxID=3456955 RepID=UPI003FA411AD